MYVYGKPFSKLAVTQRAFYQLINICMNFSFHVQGDGELPSYLSLLHVYVCMYVNVLTPIIFTSINIHIAIFVRNRFTLLLIMFFKIEYF